MQADFLDRYSRLDSPVHRLSAGGKLLVALGLVVFTVAVPPSRTIALGGVAALLLAVIAISRVPVRFMIRRMLWLEPLVLGVSLLALFGPGGWRAFVLLVVRCTLCLLTMLLLSSTTPLSDLLRVLRRVRVPGLLLTTLALMHRYLFVLVDETHRMRRARASRTFTAGRHFAWGNSAAVIGHLFVRASERAERIYAAMCARGWQ